MNELAAILTYLKNKVVLRLKSLSHKPIYYSVKRQMKTAKDTFVHLKGVLNRVPAYRSSPVLVSY